MSNPESLISMNLSNDISSTPDVIELSSEDEIYGSLISIVSDTKEDVLKVRENNDQVQLANLKSESISLSQDNDSILENSIKSEIENVSISSDTQDVLKKNSTDDKAGQNYLTLAIKDIQDKLSDVLIENRKLKNFLKQKNEAIRKQFNTIVILDNEVMQICENYKTRFFEVKSLIHHFKQQNKKLNVIITSSNAQGSSTNCNSSNEESYTTVSSLGTNGPEVQKDESIITEGTSTSLESKLYSNGDTKDLLQKIEEMTISYAQLQTKLEKVEKRREADLEQFNEQLEKCQNELEELKEKLILPENSKLLRLIKEDYKKELERKYIVEVIKLLEQKLHISSINCGKQTGRTFQEFESQHEKWHEFIESFIKQYIQDTDLDKFQAECKNIVQTFTNTELSSDHIYIEDAPHKEKIPFCDYRKILIDEQLQSIKDERTTLNAKRQYLKVLANYDKVVTQLEVLKSENLRLTEINGNTFDSHNFAEIQKCLFEEKKVFDIEKEKISEERLSIEREKQSIKEEWELLSAERTVLLEEKDQLLEESRKLELEDSLLKQKAAKLNDANFNRVNNVAINKKLHETTAELENVKKELENAHETIENLRADFSKFNNHESEIVAYKLQAEMQESEIVAMREAERNYLQQIANLSTEIHQLQEQNQVVNRNDVQNENEV